MAATIWRYTNDGRNLGILQYDSAEHVESLDGTDKLTVTCEADPQKRDRLVWRDQTGVWHEHMVDQAIRTHVGASRTTVTCSNSISELYGVIARGTIVKNTVQSILASILTGTRWTVGNCSYFGVVELETWHKNVRECIAELCELVNGELVTQINTDANGVTSRVVSIVSSRGSDSVMRVFEWGRNAANVSREVAQDEVYTAVIGYGAKVDNENDGGDYAQRITVTAASSLDLKTWGVPNGDGTFSHNYTTYTDNACTDKGFLMQQATRVMKVMSAPLVRYQFEASEVDAETWGNVHLGDRVLCIDAGFNPPMTLRERVSYIKRRLSGRVSCVIAIGERTDPMVEQYKAQTKAVRSLTGNGMRISARSPITTHGNFTVGGVDVTADVTPATGPAAISIVTPPDRTTYYTNETIDFTGLVVTLLDDNGDIYTDEMHPDGIAPINELIFPVKTAPTTEWDDFLNGLVNCDGEQIIIDDMRCAVLRNDGISYVEWPDELHRASPVYGWIDHHNGALMQRESDQFHCMWLNDDGHQYGVSSITGHYVDYNGVEHDYTHEIDPELIFLGDFRPQTVESLEDALGMSTEQISGKDIYENGTTADIPVQWSNGIITLEDSFKITNSAPDDNDGFTGSGGGKF